MVVIGKHDSFFLYYFGGSDVFFGCKKCVSGRFNAEEERSILAHKEKDDIMCKQCPLGRWSDIMGQKKELLCQNCKTGRYSNTPASSSQINCLACSSGKYLDTVGGISESQCIQCSTGSTQPQSGSAYCLPCVSGKRQHEIGSTICQNCDHLHHPVPRN